MPPPRGHDDAHRVNGALERIAALYHLPYLHLHMAFFTFHDTLNRCIRRRYRRAEPFLLTAPEVVAMAHLYRLLPAPWRSENANLMYVLYAMLTFYFSFWNGDFMSFGMREIARSLGLRERLAFEKMVLYLGTWYGHGMFGISVRSDAYEAWERFLFQKVSKV